MIDSTITLSFWLISGGESFTVAVGWVPKININKPYVVLNVLRRKVEQRGSVVGKMEKMISDRARSLLHKFEID